jgi:hypothetical protein
VLATPIDRAATAYQGLDLNETFLMRLVGDELDFFLGRIASLDIVPLKLPLPEPYLIRVKLWAQRSDEAGGMQSRDSRTRWPSSTLDDAGEAAATAFVLRRRVGRRGPCVKFPASEGRNRDLLSGLMTDGSVAHAFPFPS